MRKSTSRSVRPPATRRPERNRGCPKTAPVINTRTGSVPRDRLDVGADGPDCGLTEIALERGHAAIGAIHDSPNVILVVPLGQFPEIRRQPTRLRLDAVAAGAVTRVSTLANLNGLGVEVAVFVAFTERVFVQGFCAKIR